MTKRDEKESLKVTRAARTLGHYGGLATAKQRKKSEALKKRLAKSTVRGDRYKGLKKRILKNLK